MCPPWSDAGEREHITTTPIAEEGIQYARLRLGPHENFVYLVADPETRKAVCIDPAFDVPRIDDILTGWGVRLTHIVHTHNHPDHTEGTPALHSITEAPAYIHEDDAGLLQATGLPIQTLRGGERIDLGTVSLYVHHNPGHTAGGMTFQVGKRLFTGDFLFNETCGRCDFPTGSQQQMWSSLQVFKAKFGDDHIICPGHDYGAEPETTVRWAKQHNPALAHTEYATFADEWFLKAY